MSLGSKIREFRNERGITLTQLAKKLEVSPSFLSAVERDIKKPSLIMLKKISSYLNISLSYLMTNSESNSVTGEKLKSIRKGRGLSVDDLAELSEVPAEDIRNIEKNVVRPSLAQLEKLSTALNVTIRYFVERHSNGTNLGDKIRGLREKLDMSQAELAGTAGISPSLVSQIENNVTMPSLETLDRIAECLDVETSFFLIDTNATSQYLSSLSPEIVSLISDPKVQAILNAVRDLEPGELKFILNFLEFFKINRKELS
ncbi:MAG: transcriptional regulator [Firmicutes bacterium HGW-Firmicutes-14]|nr:MAG: transcriptional regulator [Firmicutes bacterium HGW-Firmicutes-14]